MSIPDIKALLSTEDSAARTEIITTHLEQMEVQLQQTRDAVGALRELLSPVPIPAYVEVRREPALAVWSIGATIEMAEIDSWFAGSLRRLRNAVATAPGAPSAAVPGGLYDRALFLESRGEATLFVAAPQSGEPPEGIRAEVLPQAEYAVLTHSGSHDGIDRSYGALGTYANEHLISHQGPIREHYLGATPLEPMTFTATEICWPIFSTTPPPDRTQNL
jgi:effector-binding domain-containing protein